MFASGLKGPVIIAAIAIATSCWWEVGTTLSDHQIYLVWMHLYASLYAFMEFDPAKLVTLELAGGGQVRLPMAVVRSFLRWPVRCRRSGKPCVMRSGCRPSF